MVDRGRTADLDLIPAGGSAGAHAATRAVHDPAAAMRDVSPPEDRATAASRPADAAAHSRLRRAAILQAAASLVWLPQAALLAHAVGAMAEGAAASAALLPAALVLGLGFARAGLDAIGSRLAFRAARAAVAARREAALAALAAGSPLDSGRPASGLAASVVAEQADAVLAYLSKFQPARLRAAVVPLVILAVVLPLSWAAALVLVVAAPLIPIFMALIGWRAKAASEAQLAELGGMNAFLLDRLRGLATLRGLGAIDLTAHRLRANAETLRRRTMAVLRIAFLSSAVLELFAALGVAMVAVYVGFHLLGQLPFGAWGGTLDLGRGLFILLLAPAFFEPLRELSAVWHDRAAGQAALAALDELGRSRQRLPDAAAAPASAPRRPGPPGVVVRGLGFGHAGGRGATLAGFDLTVAPGERVALLGPSGSGKSTLLALIAGLAPIEAGSVAIGGTPLTPASAAALRRRIAWIGQKPHIFAGSLRANVALGRPGIGPGETAAALRAVTLGGLSASRGGTPIGEGGGGLSGGEALRLALARAAADPAANLVLADEPTAHLDTATAAAVADGLLAVAAGRTVIVATHDPVLAARMDRVVRLEALP